MEIKELEQFAEFFTPMTCIISVRKLSDGTFGDIRLVTGNKAYRNVAESFANVGASNRYRGTFIPNSPYEKYIPKDLNFENYCCRCAVEGEMLHTYIRPDNFQFWIHLSMIPVRSDEEDVYYCSYTQTFSKEAETFQRTTISPEVSNAVLNTCIKLRSSKDFCETMEEIIQDIQKLCTADHCCVFLTDFRRRTCSVLCEAHRPGTNLKSMNDYVNQEFFDNVVSTWPDTLDGSTSLIINSAKSWEYLKQRNFPWYESMRMAGAENLVLFPLNSRDETLGYIWAINFDVSLTAKIKEMLELATFFIASEIAGYQLFQRLETLSSIDLLTGVFNRNSMNRRIDVLCSGQDRRHYPVGIVFADLNGLKQVNDNEGHSAGDALLKHASAILQKLFPDDEIYRAGGDEFMIIAVNAPEERLQQAVKALHDYPDNPEHVSFAVGFCYEQDCSCIHQAMHLADERMYQDKERYYETHPEKKYR